MSATPNLKSKCWHLNTYIKRLLYTAQEPPVQGIYYIDPDNRFNLIAPNTDTTSSDAFVFQSGKGVVTDSNKLDLDEDT